MSTGNKRSKRKRGRPRLPKAEARSKILPVRVTGEEMKQVKQVAKTAGKTVSDWARERLGLG